MRKRLTLDAFFNGQYMPHAMSRKRSWRTDKWIYDLHFAKPLGGLRMDKITPVDIEHWIQGMVKRRYLPSTINRFLSMFKTVCSLAERYGVISRSPCVNIPNLRANERKARYLTRDEAQRLMAFLKQSERREALVLRLLLLTGARKSEILMAQWDDIDFEHGILRVPVSKSGKPRFVILSNAALDLIRGIIPVAGSSYLFPGTDLSKPLGTLADYWEKTRAELGLKDVRIHDLRHSFASFLVNGGHTLYEVQKMLGHSSPQTTTRYAHLWNDSLKLAADSVGAIFTE